MHVVLSSSTSFSIVKPPVSLSWSNCDFCFVSLGIPISIGSGMCELMYKPNVTSSAESSKLQQPKITKGKRKRDAEDADEKAVETKEGDVDNSHIDLLAKDIELLVNI